MNSPSLSRHAPSHSHSLQRYTYIPFHQNLSGCGVEMEVGMRLGVRVLAIIIVVPLCSARYPKDPLHPSSLLSFWPGFWPCVSVKRSMAHLGAQTRGERTHLVKQLYPIAHRYSTHPHTHTHSRSGSVHLCGNISFGCGAIPLPTPPSVSIKSVYKRRPNCFNVQRKFSKKQLQWGCKGGARGGSEESSGT